MMDSGEIIITLQTNQHKVVQVNIQSTRPLHITRLLLGKTPEQVLTLIPLLFNICGIAQTYAAFSALSNALQIPINSKTYHAYQLLLNAEILREHCWRLCIAQDKNKLSPFVPLVQQLKKALFVNATPFHFNSKLEIKADEINKIINTIHHAIEEIFLEPPENFYNLHTESQLSTWLNNNSAIPALLLTKIYANDYQDLGRVNFPLLPELNNSELFKYLKQDNMADISRYPDWQSGVFETGSFNRQKTKPLIIHLTELYGNGLISRIVSRLLALYMTKII
jgi:uptake hydrogenase large subunit